MENEQNNNEKKYDPKDQARNLFFQTALTQAQIAELIGVSQKTISIWINEGRWKLLKETAEMAPAVLIDQMTQELAEIHYNIASREPGKRFATVQEAEIRRKIMISIKYLQEQQSPSVHAEMMMNFIQFVRRRSTEDVKKIVIYADQYLKGEKKLGAPKPFKSYSLPGQFEIPAPDGLPENNIPPPPPAEDDKPDSLKDAA